MGDALKVLFVLPEYGPGVRGGIARFYQHAIAGLRSAGCQVDVCVASCDAPERIAGDVAMWVERDEVLAAESQLSHLALAPTLRNQLAVAFAAYKKCSGGDGYDVVEVTDWGLLYVPWLAHGGRRAPVVVQLHGSPGQIGYRDPLVGEELSDLLTRAFEVAYLPRADDLHTPGLANASDWQKLLGKNVRHIPPAWPSTNPGPGSQAFGAFGVVAGRLQSWKGPELLCEACRELGDESPVILWVGGDHPFERFDQSMSNHLAAKYPEIWGRKIVAVGSQTQEITRSVQNAAGFAVHPSSWDVFALAVVESMEAGKVVVCSDQAGASWLIEHGKNGFVYPGHDFRRLAELIKHVSQLDKPTLSRIGGEAQRAVAQNLDMTKITGQRLASYGALEPRDDDRGHPWLANVFGPSRSYMMSEEVFLDGIRLKALMRYVTKRTLRRLLRANRRVPPPLRSQQVVALLESLTEGKAS